MDKDKKEEDYSSDFKSQMIEQSPLPSLPLDQYVSNALPNEDDKVEFNAIARKTTNKFWSPLHHRLLPMVTTIMRRWNAIHRACLD